MRRALVSIAGLAALLLVSAAAFADGNSNFRVDPRHAGIGAFAGWARDAGEPGQKGDPKQHGLYLQKHTATPNFAASGARITKITPMPASDLSVLAFDIPGFPGEPTFGVANG